MRFGRKFADFVEENRSAIRQLEAPKVPLRCSRERALFVAEQFGRNQRGRKRGTVHADEGPSGSRGLFVDCAREQFLAGPGFSRDQNCRVGGADFGNPGKRALQRQRGTDDLLKH